MEGGEILGVLPRNSRLEIVIAEVQLDEEFLSSEELPGVGDCWTGAEIFLDVFVERIEICDKLPLPVILRNQQ